MIFYILPMVLRLLVEDSCSVRGAMFRIDLA